MQHATPTVRKADSKLNSCDRMAAHDATREIQTAACNARRKACSVQQSQAQVRAEQSAERRERRGLRLFAPLSILRSHSVPPPPSVVAAGGGAVCLVAVRADEILQRRVVDVRAEVEQHAAHRGYSEYSQGVV